jgi:cytochrome d ubiquinol oxidase subunit I
MSHLLIAREQMALSFAVHILLASLGVGMPLLMLVAEGLSLLRRDPLWRELAQRWSKAFAVLFAAGAVSGTVLSFELGHLWPVFMARYGPALALPFSLEAVAFFIEAAFLGLYLYGWDKLGPRAHFFCGVPVALGGLASACFVVTANAWMNSPSGVRLDAQGKLLDVDPWAAMLNPFSPHEVLHTVIACYLVTGFLTASLYAFARLQGRNDAYSKRALWLALAMGCLAAPLQAASGDQAGKALARLRPLKLAALEGRLRSQAHGGLRSWLAYGDADAAMKGLDAFPREEWPPAALVHPAFQLMLAIGAALLLLAFGCAWAARGALNGGAEGRALLWAVALAGPAAVLALEAGWTVTELGRQPWIAVGLMRTTQAVTRAPGLAWTFLATILVYAALIAGVGISLRRLARR